MIGGLAGLPPDMFDRLADRIRDADGKSPAIDTGDSRALLADHQAAAVVFFLKAVGRVGEQAAGITGAVRVMGRAHVLVRPRKHTPFVGWRLNF